MAELLTKSERNQLEKAVETMASMTDAGTHPTDALLKISQEDHLSPPMIELLAQTYNVGSVCAQQDDADLSYAQKNASIDLADYESVVEKLYGSDTKQPKVSSEISPVYLQPPVSQQPRQSRYNDPVPYFKVALDVPTKSLKLPPTEAVIEEIRKKQPVKKKMTRESVVRMLESLDDKVRKASYEVEHLHFETMQHCERFRNSVFTDAKQTHLHQPLSHTKFATQQLFGDEGYNYAYAILNDLDWRTAEGKVAADFSFSAVEEPYVHLKAALDSDAELRKYEEEMGRALAGKLKAKETLKRIDKGLPAEEEADVWDSFDKKVAASNSAKNFADPKKLFDIFGDGAKSDREIQREVNDNKYRIVQDRINNEMMLNDFLTYDDVLKTYDPEDVILAYQELSRTAPVAIRRPGIARSFLRAYLAQSGLSEGSWMPLIRDPNVTETIHVRQDDRQ